MEIVWFYDFCNSMAVALCLCICHDKTFLERLCRSVTGSLTSEALEVAALSCCVGSLKSWFTQATKEIETGSKMRIAAKLSYVIVVDRII